MDYKEMLARARSQLPEKVFEKARFEIPKAASIVEGKRTIVTNFAKVCDIVQREEKDVLKYLSKELAAPAEISSGGRATFTGKFSTGQINSKLEKYVSCYVLCHECEKPDTKLIKEDRIFFLKCMACGARHPVKK